MLQTLEKSQANIEQVSQELQQLQNISVELCGTWLWISGDTKQHKTILKQLGCTWAWKKEKWFFHEGGYRKTGKSTLSMERIRELYGHQTLK